MNNLFQPGRLTITRVESNQQEPAMMIQIRSGSGRRAIYAEASLLEFMRALSGIGETECQFRTYPDAE